MNKITVYGYYCTETEKWYIGQTIMTMKKRASVNGSGYKNSTKFWKAIREFGWENFEPHILKENLSLSEANELEKYWISEKDSFNNGYNGTAGGRRKFNLSEEHKNKISKALSGKPKSQESIEKMRKSLTGKK